MKIKTLILTLSSLLFASYNSEAQIISKNDKVLVVYYSKSGNTQEIANQIHSIAGGDIIELVPVTPYPEEYRATTAQAKKEISEGYKPELKTKIANIANYDVIFVGSPCWWGTVASPVSTFLSEHDLAGKKIVPFMTHGGSGLGHSVEDIKKMLPNSTIVEGKAFRGSSVKNAKNDVTEWLKGMQND